MKQIKELKATEGMFLTQVADTEDRVFVTSIKGFGLNEYDWKEVTLQEKEAWEKAHEIKEDA